MTPITAYDPATWTDPFHTDPRKPLLLDWLTANNINPDDVPTDQPVYITDAPEGGQVIAYTALVRDDEGRIRARGDEAVTEPRTAPYTVALPDTLNPNASKEQQP